MNATTLARAMGELEDDEAVSAVLRLMCDRCLERWYEAAYYEQRQRQLMPGLERDIERARREPNA